MFLCATTGVSYYFFFSLLYYYYFDPPAGKLVFSAATVHVLKSGQKTLIFCPLDRKELFDPRSKMA
jgi:hypothetical protein